jgi:hypothetical protein
MTAGVAVNLIALGALLALVLWWARRPTEAVRLRNALRLQPSREEDFNWVPPRFPSGYAVEHRPPDIAFRDIVASLGVDAKPGDWGKALALAGHLTERARDQGPVRADPLTTYRAVREGCGYCADFVKVFMVLAHAAGLVARQWAFSFDGFGGHGHAVVEVFDRQRGRWLLLDVYNNFHFVDAASGEPLSAFEYRDALLGRRGIALIRRNGPGRPGFIHENTAVDYYRRGIDQWYLVWGNAVSSYYSHPAVRWSGRISRWLAHLVANVVGAQPHIRIYATPANAQWVQRMFALRRRLQWVMFAGLLLLVALVVQLLALGAPARAGA